MRFTINIEKMHFYAIVLVLAVAIGIAGVTAYGTSEPATFGHSAGEVDVTLADGSKVTLQDAITQGLIGGKEEIVLLPTPAMFDASGKTVTVDMSVAGVPTGATEMLVRVQANANFGDCHGQMEMKGGGIQDWFIIASTAGYSTWDTMWLPITTEPYQFKGYHTSCQNRIHVLGYKILMAR